MTDTRTFICPSCKQNVVADVPKHDIVNRECLSMFVMVHEEQVVCQKCGQPFGFFITGVKGLEYGWKPLSIPEKEGEAYTPPKNPEQKRIIMP